MFCEYPVHLVLTSLKKLPKKVMIDFNFFNVNVMSRDNKADSLDNALYFNFNWVSWAKWKISSSCAKNYIRISLSSPDTFPVEFITCSRPDFRISSSRTQWHKGYELFTHWDQSYRWVTSWPPKCTVLLCLETLQPDDFLYRQLILWE